MAEANPHYFTSSAKGQTPRILWIGCSDSRIPETVILGTKPGEVFVHRNIANMIHSTDLSSLAVIEFSVRHLKVQHIIVCGHTSCGGVGAVLGNQTLGILDTWLQPMRQLRYKHAKELESLEGDSKSTKLSQLNIKNGLETLRGNATVIEAMKERGLQLHGTVYNLSTGTLEPLESEETEDDFKARLTAFEMK